MNLIQSFTGEERFYSKFNRSMFRSADNGICIVDVTKRTNESIRNRQIGCKKLRYTASGRASSTWDNVYIPHEFFADMSVFAIPSLGWRSAAAGKFLSYFSKDMNSYHRGTAAALLQRSDSPFTNYLQTQGAIDLIQETTEPKLVGMIMEPNHLSFREGIERMRSGRLASFTVNEDVAVTPSYDDTYDIWYKTKVVGSINENGVISCPMKYITELEQEN